MNYIKMINRRWGGWQFNRITKSFPLHWAMVDIFRDKNYFLMIIIFVVCFVIIVSSRLTWLSSVLRVTDVLVFRNYLEMKKSVFLILTFMFIIFMIFTSDKKSKIFYGKKHKSKELKTIFLWNSFFEDKTFGLRYN